MYVCMYVCVYNVCVHTCMHVWCVVFIHTNFVGGSVVQVNPLGFHLSIWLISYLMRAINYVSMCVIWLSRAYLVVRL